LSSKNSLVTPHFFLISTPNDILLEPNQF